MATLVAVGAMVFCLTPAAYAAAYPTASRGEPVTAGDRPLRGDSSPSAGLHLNVRSGPAPLRVVADGSPSADDASVTSYTVDWGDGSHAEPEVAAVAEHTYRKSGNYTITLTVSDSEGRSSTTTRRVVVQKPRREAASAARPSAAVVAKPSSAVAGRTVRLDATASRDNTGVTSYAFDFGDGTRTLPQPSAVVGHAYADQGRYKVSVTTTDAQGRASSASSYVTVKPDVMAKSSGRKAPKPTVVSFTFDDTFAEQAAAMKVLHDYGLTGTVYVNSPRIGTSGYLTRAQLDSFVAAGSEVGAHTLSHADLASAPPDEARKQVCNDRVNLMDMGYRVTSIAYPFGSANATVKQIVQECGYNSGRGVADLSSPGYGCVGCATAETIPPRDVWKIRTNQSVQTDTTLDMLKNYVTQAENDQGGWVPLIFHHVCNACASNAIDLNTFTAFVDWMSKRPSTTSVRTVDQVVGGALKPPVPYVPPATEATGVTVGTQTRPIDGTNTYRGTNMLILYTPAKGARTSTNPYGTEVSVVNGVVTKVETSVGNMPIPSNGFVLSGHGTSNTWMRYNVKVGMSVTIRYGSG